MTTVKRTTKSLLLLLGALLATTSPARAQTDATTPAFAPMAQTTGGFGAPTQWVLTMSTTPTSGFVFVRKVSGGSSEIALHPALDYFIADHISVGGVVGIDYVSGDAGSTRIDLGARIGYDLNIQDRIGVWPMAGLLVSHVSDDANHSSNTATSLTLFAPFLYHPAPHVFVGLGPSFQLGLSGGDYKQYGLDFALGGWI
jgi:hypothetical protein